METIMNPNCKTCGFPHSPNELWTGQCIQCVGKERDQLEDRLIAVLLKAGHKLTEVTDAIIVAKENAKHRIHP